MPVIQKSFGRFLIVLCGAALLAGCMDPGSRALLNGEKLIKEGKYAKAVTELKDATHLLPRNAQAWNHLGLAYHHQRDYAEARKAYTQAINLDYNLAAARFNMGSLLLENNDIPAAIDQLTSYTLLQPRSVEGWVKLGAAQLRAKRLDAAEKAFKTALEISPNDCEALNGIGNVQFYRRRNQEALVAFNRSLELNPHYTPALLNAAIVTHQSLNNRSVALQMYRRYAAQQPKPANADAVIAVANQLDQELNPPPPIQAVANVPARTNASVLQTNTPSRTAATTVTSAVPGSAQRLATGPPPNILSKPPTPQPATNVVSAKPSEPAGAKVKETPVEVTRLPDDLTIRPAQDLSSARTTSSRADTSSQPTSQTDNASSAADRRNFLARLNPFATKSKTSTNGNAPVTATELPQTTTSEPQVPPPSFPRYTYLNPPKPSVGNRKAAETSFAAGVRAQRSGNMKEALAGYAKAIDLDPAYFEAHYNRGLAAYELGNWTESLRAYEYALALKPDSVDARYNFALALKSANYVDDAIQQLTQITKTNPGEARAHLSLANLYAYRLNQPRLARQHFAKVLETDPRHPQAAEIRFWLAAHPM